MYKTLGEYSWRGFFLQIPDKCPANTTSNVLKHASKPKLATPFAGDIHFTFDNLKSVC